MTRFTVLVAAPQTRSALRAAAVHTADAIAAHTGLAADIDTIDLAELGPELLAEEVTDGVADALATIAATDVLVVATPQVHGSYAGLLKVFLDRLPELGLAHVIALPLAAVEDLRNGYNIESDLRVLLSDLGAWVAEPGLVLTGTEVTEPLSVIDAWAEVTAPALLQALSVAV
ncbi:NADPH-dependent FMN reductase [Thermobifida cellulosilytica]|uniref:Flavoprotein n=1 Tax=Thermobifida cellulosilytica TB100 TaxID=665004 RepID=A0A147KE10_THECS|nr:NAD(P)H-dependent oxidoreductase [Thermobifida cellulosilytica]KUP95523.1 flavoprotein [Thermobifida cellulosilytica TB100]